MKKSLLPLSLMLSLIAGSAQAATIDIDLADLSSTMGGSLTPNTLFLAPSTSLGAGALVIGSPDPANPTSYSFAIAPSGSLYGGNYLAVLGAVARQRFRWLPAQPAWVLPGAPLIPTTL